MPTRKVTGGALAGAISILIAGALKQFAGLEMSAETGMALTVVITFATQYFVKDGEGNA